MKSYSMTLKQNDILLLPLSVSSCIIHLVFVRRSQNVTINIELQRIVSQRIPPAKVTYSKLLVFSITMENFAEYCKRYNNVR